MCLAMPGKIISIDSSNPYLRMARVDFGGIIKDIVIEWVDATEGSYVLAHAGFAITMVDSGEAQKSLDVFSEIINILDSK